MFFDWKKKILSRLKKTNAHLISFPKCGRTWLRSMIGFSIKYHFNTTAPVEDVIDLTPLANYSLSIPRVRVSHDNAHRQEVSDLTFDKAKYKDEKVIFLIRDPRDVIVSWYFHKKYREKDLEGGVSSFMRSSKGGFESIIRFYNLWDENVKHTDQLEIIRYEDIHECPNRELKRCMKLVGLKKIQSKTIKKSVKECKFEKMRKMELKEDVRNERLRPKDKRKVKSYKTRKGKVGGYKDELNEEDIEYANQVMSNLNESVSYK